MFFVQDASRELIVGNSGLDNAGKTTIVKKILNEDINTVSPTLGFIIKTIDFEGYVQCTSSVHMNFN